MENSTWSDKSCDITSVVCDHWFLNLLVSVCEHWFCNLSFSGWDSLLLIASSLFLGPAKCKNHHATSAVCPSQDFQMVQKSWRKNKWWIFSFGDLCGALIFPSFEGCTWRQPLHCSWRFLKNPRGWMKILLNKVALFEHLVDFPHIQQKHLTRYDERKKMQVEVIEPWVFQAWLLEICLILLTFAEVMPFLLQAAFAQHYMVQPSTGARGPHAARAACLVPQDHKIVLRRGWGWWLRDQPNGG